MKRTMFLRSLAVMLGAGGGFAYYYYIGCTTGSCAITSNPWISTIYGALIGWLVVPKRQTNTVINTNEKEEHSELRDTKNN